jgi:uncharacterized protein (DUF924 family)
VLVFWFGALDAQHSRPEWFRKDPAFDALIRQRFGATVEAAVAGGLAAWQTAGPRAQLAQIVVLDQFTRNIFRDTPRAFAGDTIALAAAQQMVASGQDRSLTPVQRSFVYLPFEHAENLAMQDEAVRCFTALGAEHPPSADQLTWAHKHHEVIVCFGRFPHRNAILGRPSTPEEEAFLALPGSRF